MEFLESPMIGRIVAMRLPRYGQLPALDLYMDQVISVVNTALRPLFPMKEAVLTPTMVGNYVKQKLIPPPIKKKYRRDHVAYIIAIVLLKQVYAMAEVAELIQRQVKAISVEEAYDYFCGDLEASLQSTFRKGDTVIVSYEDDKLKLIRVVVASLTQKIYVQKQLEFSKTKAAE